LRLKKTFRPEFLNRLDEIIVFHELNEEQLRQVVDLLAKDLQKRLAERKLSVEITEKAKSWAGERRGMTRSTAPGRCGVRWRNT